MRSLVLTSREGSERHRHGAPESSQRKLLWQRWRRALSRRSSTADRKVVFFARSSLRAWAEGSVATRLDAGWPDSGGVGRRRWWQRTLGNDERL